MMQSAKNPTESVPRERAVAERSLWADRAPRRGGALAIVALLVAAGATAILPDQAAGQDAEEAVMVAAGEWALERTPQGSTRLDPHRSGAGKDGARVQRVAQSLGATPGTLEETRRCTDALDPSTCRLEAGRLLAVGAPRIEGDQARVKVYVWYPTSTAREPVAQRSWDLVLRKNGQAWRVVSGG